MFEKLICFVYANICLENLSIYVRKINVTFIDCIYIYIYIYIDR